MARVANTLPMELSNPRLGRSGATIAAVVIRLTVDEPWAVLMSNLEPTLTA